MYLLKNKLELTLLTLGQVYETHSGHQQSLLEIGNNVFPLEKFKADTNYEHFSNYLELV